MEEAVLVKGVDSDQASDAAQVDAAEAAKAGRHLGHLQKWQFLEGLIVELQAFLVSLENSSAALQVVPYVQDFHCHQIGSRGRKCVSSWVAFCRTLRWDFKKYRLYTQKKTE